MPVASAFRIPHRLRAAACALLLAAALPAAADDGWRQVPGVYRQSLGTLRVTALFDGVVALPRSELLNVDPERMQALLRRQFVPEMDGGLQTAVNAYLVRNGETTVLVDAGTADCFDGLGRIPDNLRSAGVAPGEVDIVLLTHAHPDHMCGLLDRDGRMLYPEATVWLAEADAAHWLSQEAEAAASPGMRPLYGMARRALAPYIAQRRLHRFAPDAAMPVAWVEALDTRGHTPGHTSYLFDGGNGERLLVWGDIVHYHAVQFARPDASYEPDSDRARAIATRRELMRRASTSGWWVAGAHLPFPGLGHVRAEDDAFAWVPAEFSPLPTD